MFKLFANTEKPISSHSRSKTLPHPHCLSGNGNTLSAATTTANGHNFQFIEPTSVEQTASTKNEPLASAPLAEPTKAHQRTLTEQVRSTKDLPPLIIQASESMINSTSQPLNTPSLDSLHQLNEFQFSPEQSRQSSPSRPKRLSMLTGDHDAQGKGGEKTGKLGNWFKGESQPISIGILPSPTKEKADPLEAMAPSSDIRPTTLLQRKSTTPATSKPASASRFSFFTSKVSSAKQTPQSLSDEFTDMDIRSALIPTGSAEPFSPAAFKNLQQQAEGLLSKLQNAYKERTVSLRDMMAEKEALIEEAEGAETRARHLKMQLDDMSVKLAEQDDAMMNLVDELAQEKQARREEETRKQTVKLIEYTTPPTARQGRTSRSNTVSDSGFESEDDSSAESVFSRQEGTHSPAMSISSVSTNSTPEACHSPNIQSPSLMPQAARVRLATSHPTKVTSPFYRGDIPEETGCANCEGMVASEAWNVLRVLKEENKGLKHRVSELEGALDGCLDVVGRLGF